MNRPLRFLAMAAAGAMLTHSIPHDIADIRMQMPDINGLRGFAEQLAQSGAPETPFCSLRFSAQEQLLYRDGTAVGQNYAECSVQNGSLVISEDGQTALTPQEAAEQLGCEVTAENGDITVSFPFQTARLIVKSMQEPALYGGELIASGYRDLYVVQYGSQRDAFRAYQAYQQDADICYADCDRILAAADIQSFQAETPSAVCGTAEIGADDFCTWLKSEISELPEIRAAVIDSGIYAEHSWLKGRVLAEGANFCSGISADFSDDFGHGTHCSGIIASGTPENVKLLPVKVLDRSGYGSLLSIYCGIMYALEQNADVINLSLGGYGESPLLDEAVDAAAEADIPLCTAAGNNQQNVRYIHPAYSEKVITVSAVDRQHRFAEFSNYGETVDFAAPGVAVVSAYIGAPDAVRAEDGTSMAAPFVTAAVADLLSYDPSLTGKQIYDNLRSNAVDLGEKGFDEQYGWGEISLKDFHFADAFCRPPVISPNGGRYWDAVSVTLTADSDAEDGTEIYYTTDGSEPQPATAIRYTGGTIRLERSARIRAITVCGDAQSRTVTAAFCISNEDIDNPFETADGVLTAYRGILSSPDLSALNGTVTAVGEGAFAQCAELRSVTLPESITSIGADAFSGCSNLTAISGPSVTSVGASAFSGCTALQSAGFLPLTQLGESAFLNCENLRMLKNGLSDSLTVIAENSFHGCAGLTDLSMPAVTEIGAYAFAGCGKLRITDDTVWERLGSIGAHAFESAGLSGTVRLTSLRTLGAYAFADSRLGELVLPDTLAVLPEGVCRNNPKLRKLTAAGVTALEPYALQQATPSAVILDMDFSKITALGCSALEGIRFTEAVTFSALQSAEDGALDGIEGPAFFLPAVQSLGEHAVTHAENAVLYFENLAALRTDAVKQVRALVVGEKLETAEPGCASAEILAGPAQSPLEQYAAQTHGNFKHTPSLLTNQKQQNVNAGDSLQLQALPLGFGGLRVRWTDASGTTLQEDAAGMFLAETVSAGEHTYRAALYLGDAELDAAEFHIHAVKNSAPRPIGLETDEVQIIALHRAVADGTAVSSDGHSYHITYRFRADHDSTLTLLMAGACDSVRIRDAEGNDLPYERDLSTTAQNAVFTAKKDCSYLIELSMIYNIYQIVSPVCALRLTERAPSELTPLSDSSIRLQAEEGKSYVWQGEPVIPEQIGLQQAQDSADSGLIEGEDYIVFCTNNTSAGMAVCWLIGTGDYCGSRNFSYQIVGRLQEGVPLKTGLGQNDEMYLFTPEEDGDYMIYLDYTEEWLAQMKAADRFDSQVWQEYWGTAVLENDEYNIPPIGSQNADDCSFSANQTYSLKKGVQYRILLNRVLLDRVSSDQMAQMAICAERGVRHLNDWILTFEGEQDFMQRELVQLESDRFEPEIFCDPALTEGTDYTVDYVANGHAGEMGAIIRGIGAQRGTRFLSCQLIGELEPSGSVSVHQKPLTEMFYRFIPEVSGSYLFWTDYPAQLLADAENTGYFDPADFADSPGIELELKAADFGRLRFDSSGGTNRFAAIEYELTAGETYYVKVLSDSLSDYSLHAEYARRSITEAEVTGQTNLSEDTLRTDPVTVTCGGAELHEGTDYALTLLNGGNGQYLAVLKGIGDFGGSCYCTLTVTGNAKNTELESGVPFVQKQAAAEYTLTLEKAAVVRLRPADQSAEPFYAALCDEAGTKTISHFDSDMQNVTLEAGTYTVKLEQAAGTERSYVLEILHTFYPLAECTADVQNTVYTGQAIRPEIRLSYRNEPAGTLTRLKEGTDYRITGQDTWTAPGQYHVQLTGIGNYFGSQTVSFCILPPEPEELPLLTDGEWSAEITSPGSSVLYRWEPGKQRCIVSDCIRNKHFCFYSGTELAAEYSGAGYQYFTPETAPGIPCVVSVSFCNASETGKIGFRVQSDFRELALCQAETEEAVRYDPEGSIPAFSVRDGQTLLREGTDYTVFSVGGEKHCGMAEIVLRGKGRYVGERTLNYYIYPKDADSLPTDDALSEKEIGLRVRANFSFTLPDEAALYTFTAPEDGTYYLVKRMSTADAVSVFVYLPDGSLNPVHRTELRLSANDSIRILLIHNRVNPKPRTEGQLYVTDAVPSYIWTDEAAGITYFIRGDCATITDIDTDAVGVTLPDEITDPDNGDVKTVTDIHADVLRDCAGKMTFYLTPGGSAEQHLAGYDLCCAYASPQAAEKGDVTGTDGVNQNDVLTLLRILSESKGMMLSETAAEAADCNGDGILDLLDVREIMRMIRNDAQ